MNMSNCNCSCNCIPVKNCLCIDPDDLGSIVGGGIIPNLQIGVETKWPMLYQGKQMYAQLVNYGALPNKTTKYVPHNISNVEYIQVHEAYSFVRSPIGIIFSISYIDLDAIGECWSCFIHQGNVGIQTKVNRSQYNAIVCVLYTKTTDEPVIP